jgi:hypothetical protein
MNNYVCTSCDIKYCEHCFCIENEGHVCSKEDIDSANYVKENTKPCPNCFTRIERSEGCNDMWCTKCHTRIDWATGKRSSKRHFHNPMEQEHRRRLQNRQIGDITCGGQADWREMYHKINTITSQLSDDDRYQERRKNTRFFSDISNLINSIRTSKIRDIGDLLHSYNTNLNDRLLYLKDKISKNEFSKRCMKKEIDYCRVNEYNCIFDTLCTLLEEITRIVVDESTQTVQQLLGLQLNTLEICSYINTCLENLAKQYNNVPFQIIYSENNMPSLALKKLKV